VGFVGFYYFFEFYGGFRIFYLNKQLGNSFVNSAHQLSFYLDSPDLDYLKICKVITYWSLLLDDDR